MREEKDRLKSRFQGRLHSGVIDIMALNPGGMPNKVRDLAQARLLLLL